MCLDPWRFGGGGRRTRSVGHLSLTAAGAPWRFLQIRREEEEPDQFVFSQVSRGEERTREREGSVVVMLLMRWVRSAMQGCMLLSLTCLGCSVRTFS
jgi:hypothetical protein